MRSTSNEGTRSLRILQFKWASIVFLSYVLTVYVGNLFLHALGQYWTQWMIQTSLFLAFQWGMLLKYLPCNRRSEGEALLSTFGPGSALTIIRAFLLACIAGFLFIPRPPGFYAWIPGLLYVFADFTDFFDGFAARLSNHATQLGERLDMTQDSVGVIVVTLLSFQYGSIPWWYIPFSFARYFFVFGLWIHKQRGMPEYDLPYNPARRGFAALQMGFMTAMLFPIVGPPATHVAAGIFMTPFTIGFIYDWLHVTGNFPKANESSKLAWQRIWYFAYDWLPGTLRFFLYIDIWLIWQRGVTDLVSGLELFLVLCLAVGFLGRTLSIGGLLLIASRMNGVEPPFIDWFVFISMIVILFLGSGKFSLWRQDDWFVKNRAGDQVLANS